MTTHYSPPERTYGRHYDVTKDLTAKEIAAHMRKVIRQAAKDQLIPADWTYSVRYRSYSGGCAIDVIVAVPDELLDLRDEYEAQHNCRYYTFLEDLVDKYAPLATLRATEVMLDEIHRGYNYNGSDSMTDYFDVRFYGNVTVQRLTWYRKFYV